MIISVISPHARAGKTVASIMLAQAIGYTQNMTVLLMSTSESKTMTKYCGLEDEDDITAVIGQVVELVNCKAITPKDIPDYCRRISTNCTLLDTTTETFSRDEIVNLVHTVATMSETDITIVECDKPLKDSEIIIHVLNEDTESIRLCRKSIEKLDDSIASQFYIFNKFNPKVSALRDLAKELGVPYRFVGKIHLSDVIEKECKKEKLDTMMPYIIEKEPTVIELNADFKECVQYILSTIGQKIKWEG